MIAHASLDAIVLRNKVAIVFMRLLDAITRDYLMRLFYSDCQPQYYDNYTRASARWK